MPVTTPLLIEYKYNDAPCLAWLSVHHYRNMEFLVETLSPYRRNVLRLNSEAEWEENGHVTPLTEAIGKGIEKVKL